MEPGLLIGRDSLWKENGNLDHGNGHFFKIFQDSHLIFYLFPQENREAGIHRHQVGGIRTGYHGLRPGNRLHVRNQRQGDPPVNLILVQNPAALGDQRPFSQI